VDPVLARQASNVLELLHRARQVFGGETVPADPPAFSTPPDLEGDLGRGSY
jgi:hypothetical protein